MRRAVCGPAPLAGSCFLMNALNARFSSIRVNAAAFFVETAADLADVRLKEEGLWMSKIRILNGGFGARTDHTGSHCPYGRSGAKISRPAAAIFTKHHTLGADEQDYTGTAAFAEQFIRHVIRLRDRQRRGENSPVGKGQPGAPDEMACPSRRPSTRAPDRVIGVRSTPSPDQSTPSPISKIEPGGSYE
jgi:hypothetical protein